VGTQIACRAWVVKDDEKHFAPEVLVRLVVDEDTKGATCPGKRCGYASVAKKCRDDDDLLDQFGGEREQ
jgi:hypothetical protein